MAATNLHRRRVLIVDNDRDTVDILEYALDQCGAVVASATTTREALDLLNSWVPDILVSDFVMPDDGTHLAARAKELKIPAIAITGRARPDEQEQIVASGFVLCVTKPFDAEELCRTIASYLKIAPDNQS